MGIIKGFIAIWKIVSWLRSEKKAMEADIDGYLTQERALEWRLQLEKIAQAIEYGNDNWWKMPAIFRWFFDRTTADNRIGKFMGWLLKSRKLQTDDREALDKPIKPYRAH